MSNRDPYSDSVEFCFTLKTYLKGAPFYNAPASGLEARFWIAAAQRAVVVYSEACGDDHWETTWARRILEEVSRP